MVTYTTPETLVKVGTIREIWCPEENTYKYEVVREWFRQGVVFKDEEAFNRFMDVPCYVGELNEIGETEEVTDKDEIFTKRDFLRICDGDLAMAEKLFSALDWQSPYSEMDELLHDGEFEECEKCGRLYDRYGEGQDPDEDKVFCPYCGEPSHGDGMI